MLTKNASKADEIRHWNVFLDSLEAGTYLHSMFSKYREAVEQEIRNDFAIGPVANVLAAREEARAELTAIEQKVAKLTTEVANLSWTRDQLSRQIRDMRETARKISEVS
jgi:hypothetical protein